MEVTRAEIDAIYDAAGRLVVTPNALTLEGQRNVPADLRPGETLAAFLARHVPGIESGGWTVMIGGAVVPQAMWARTYPKHGQLIACRALPRRSALQLVAIAALTYFSGGIASSLYGAAGGTYVSAAAGTWISAIQTGVFVAGSMLINKVLGPKVTAPQALSQKQIWSLSDQRNAPRPYESFPVLWGEMRVTPDLASKPYGWYEGEYQYLSTILLGGINVHEAFDLAIGDTPIGSYSDVALYFNGFPGMASQDVPLYSNVDSIPGGEFVNGGDWITRTGSAGAGALQLDIEGQLYDVDGKGNIGPNSVDLTIEHRLVGSTAWQPLLATTLVNASSDALRRTFSFDVAPGQYEVRARLGVPRWNDGGSADACKFAWVSLKSVQADTADYSQWGRIGIKIRASGQLNGALDTVRATYRAKPMPIWTGTEWATATTRANGLSNPGAILLQTLRGIWVQDKQGRRILQFGFGLSDEQIDIEGLKAFMLHCTARGYTYDKWITSNMSLGAFCEEVALAGMGQFTWTDGSRPTASFVTNGQPNSAVVNMANMLKGGFAVDYALSNAADGIEYQWLSRDTWEMTTLRVKAPGVTTMLNPARITGEGITSEAHAAIMARYHLAQSLYQYKTIHYTADIEHLDYRRLSVLSVSHDLTQWGFGGRLIAAERVGGQVRLTLDEPVPPLATPYIGLRVPGGRDYRVWPVQPLASESDVLTLVGAWPADLEFPGEGLDNPAHDTLWCYDFKSTPGYRVRVTGIDPESDLKGARVTAVPEGPEFWDYVLNGNYVPAPNQSSIPQLGRPAVKNLRVSEKVNLQGDTEWYELSCLWDVEGDYDHAQVWAGRDGSELRLVDGNAVGSRSTFRIDGAGEWLIEVRPFNPGGQAGHAAQLLYITTMTQLPPRNPGTFVVQQVDGGLRRFAWLYNDGRPAALAGVQIRYVPGDVPLNVAMWDNMQPLGQADDVYAAQFETTKPDAGQWTFGLRAIDTAGQLANGIVRYVAVLDKVFDNLEQPDLTPPPAPTGVSVTSALANIMLSWDQPAYTMGHGHKFTRVYAAEITSAQPNPARNTAKVAAEVVGPVGSIARALGTSWRLWFVNVTNDGVESADAGPINATVGKIGNTDLGPLIVQAGNLADNAVTAAKIAAAAVDATKFAAGIEPVGIVSGGSLPTVKSTSAIVFGGKLYRWDTATGKYTSAVPTVDLTGQIASAQLADNAVTVAKIAAGAVDAGKLASNAVTADKIAAAAVDATKFASGIEPVGIVSGGSLPTVKSTTTIVWQNKLYRWDAAAGKYTADVSTVDLTGQIASAQLADNAVTVAKIAAGAVDAGKLASNAVTADKIAAAAVDATKFASGIEPVGIVSGGSLPTVKSTSTIVWQNKLYRWDASSGKYTAATAAADVTGQLTDAQLAAISAAKLTGQITGTQITDGAISTPKIAAGAVTASQIAAGAVTAGKIAANAVTAAEIAAGAITTAKLAAGAVTANEIAANAVTTAKIAAGAVTAAEIAAGAVTASKVVIGDTSNLVPDSDLQDPAAWTNSSAFSFEAAETADNTARAMTYIAAPVTGAANAYRGESASWPACRIEAGRALRLTMRVRDYIGSEGVVQLSVTRFQAGSTNTTVLASYSLGQVDGYTDLAGNYTVLPTDIGISFRVRMQYSAAGNFKGPFKVLNPVMRLMGQGDLIVDGSITATKIAAGAITAGKVAAGSITATELATGSVTTAKVAAGAITANEIATNAITAVKIAAGAVTAGKIAANAVTANEIASNAITTAKIAAGAVTATEIAANAVTARHLVLADFTNLVANSNFDSDMAGWESVVGVTTGTWARYEGAEGVGVLATKLGTYTGEIDFRPLGFVDNSLPYIPVTPGEELLVSCTITRKAGASGGNVGLYSYQRTNAGVGVSRACNGVSSNTPLDTPVAVANVFVVPADCVGIRFRLYYGSHAASANGAVAITNISVRRRAGGSLIVDGAITAAKIAAKAITAAQIAAGTITTAELGANSVTTAQIAAGAVTANEIATNAITAVKIAAGAVTAGKIAANAVTANEIAANAVTTAQIAAGAVTATEIAAGAITAAKLAITATNTINLDPFFQDASLWTSSTISRKAVAGAPGPFVLFSTANTSILALGTRTPIDTSKTYLFETWFMALAAHSNRAFATIRFFDENGNAIVGQNPAGWPGNNSSAGNQYFPSVATVTPQAWTRYTLTVGPDGVAKFPAGAASFAVGAYLNYAGAAPIVETQWGGLRVTEMSRGELIVDGAITATKIAANAIAVGTAAIQNGAIVNAMIANAAIDNAKIANLNVTKLTGGNLSVGSYINSSNYVAGSSGWSINANGQAEFSGVIVRGTVYATAGNLGGITINANGLNAGGYSGYGWPPAGQSGFHLGPNGLLLGNFNNGRWVEIQADGNLSMPGFSVFNGNATFSGNLSGASGTFSGTLTAARVITTGNLEYNAATVPLFVQADNQINPGSNPFLSLGIPAFDGASQCAIDFGFVYQASANSSTAVYVVLHVDGVEVWRTITTYGDPNMPFKFFNFSWLFPGNGSARNVNLYLLNADNVRGRFMRATIFKR